MAHPCPYPVLPSPWPHQATEGKGWGACLILPGGAGKGLTQHNCLLSPIP